MAQYILSENKQIVHLGPIDWRPRQIQSELNDLNVTFTVPLVEQGYININGSLELFPINSISMPIANSGFQSHAGPFYTYSNTYVDVSYQTVDLPLTTIKSTLKNSAASARYNKEVAGTKGNVLNTLVTIGTSREARNIFIEKYILMGAADTINWKFPEGWLTLTKTDLGNVIAIGASYVQSQFTWEQNMGIQIDTAADIPTLMNLNTQIVANSKVGTV